jgi:hypothetical protein
MGRDPLDLGAYASPYAARVGDRILMPDRRAAFVLAAHLYPPGPGRPADCPIDPRWSARRVTTSRGAVWLALAPPED